MSKDINELLGRMREKYARAFGVPLSEVGTDTVLNQGEEEIGRVFALHRDDLPVWTTGTIVHVGPPRKLALWATLLGVEPTRKA